MLKNVLINNYNMRKRQTAKQENILNNLKKTYNTYELLTALELGHLQHPKNFPISNESRFYRYVSNRIIKYLEEVRIGYHDLPASYKTKIIANKQFRLLFTEEIFPSIKKEELKKKKAGEDAVTYDSYIMYQSFFNIGIEGLIRSMPTGFQNYLLDQITPLMRLMDSITFFYRSTTGKKDIPFPYEIPETIEYNE